MVIDRRVLRRCLLSAMDRYVVYNGVELLSSLLHDRIVEQIPAFDASGDVLNLCVEVHPEYVSTDDPAAAWISTNWNGMSEFGVLLIYKDGHIEKGEEFSSI